MSAGKGWIMVPARVSLVTVGTQDFAAMKAFYRSLGWEEAMTGDDFVVFKTGGALLALFSLDELVKDANVTTPVATDGFKGVTLAINVEERDKVDEVINGVKAAGARILKEPVDAFWGGRTAYFADPENNVWEVAWLPGSSFDERGGLIAP
jgi:catechol 2,3-dioxygenase-like lactoylglutathione lyase family enzyme